jgi:multidrug efflux pump subunit AcrB
LAKDLKRRLKKSRRVQKVDVNSSYYSRRDDFQQYKLRLDDATILAKNLNRRQVISTLMLDLNPTNTVGKVEFEGQEMHLLGRSQQGRTYENDMMQKVRSFGDTRFNVAGIGQIVQEGGLNEIRRTNQSYERSVTVDYLGNYRMGREYIESVIEQTPVPVGASIKFGRGFFSFGNDKNTRNIIFIALLSLLSVWMIVSALLESVKYPLFVIMAVPYSLIGIMLGSLANDLAFDRGAIAGALLCIGVVVNNAILLYHQKQLENENGIFGLRCWMHVYQKRIRAILITTVTTITGLIPMMLFGNNEFWENLAIVVIWGLSASTILLLIMTGIRWKKEQSVHA